MDSAKPTDHDHRIIQGDCLAVLRTLSSESVQCCVTSPPYFGLRDYGVDGQIGLEPTPAEFVAKMVEVFEEVRRVLRKDGTLWLNLGDSYATGTNAERKSTSTVGDHVPASWSNRNQSVRHHALGLKPKDLMGMPWRVAFALQEAGWWLRQDIIWSKPNPMPESVTDRCTKAHEYIFLLTKSAKYFYDAEAVKEEVNGGAHARGPGNKSHKAADAYENGDEKHRTKSGLVAYAERQRAVGVGPKASEAGSGIKYNESFSAAVADLVSSRNKRSVWTVTTQPMPDAHFATFPPKLIEPCILAGTSEKGCCAACGSPWERIVEKSGGTIGKSWHDHDEAARLSIGQRGGTDVRAGWDTYRVDHLGWQKTCKCETDEVKPCVVLDPFNGAGTTMLVSKRLGRRSIGIELNPEYIKIAERRLEHWHRTQPPRLAKEDSALGPLFELMEEMTPPATAGGTDSL